MPNRKNPGYDDILRSIMKEKGGSPEDYRKLLDYIAYHESAKTMDPTIVQKGGGPGRGKYQFEGANGSNRLLTSAQRTANYLKKLGKPIPSEISRILSGDINDATQLHPEMQDMLVLGDLRMKDGIDLKDYTSGKLKTEDLWVDHWWAGDKAERPAQKAKFIQDMQNYDNNKSLSVQPKNEYQSVSLRDSIPDLSNIFKYGGNMYPNGGQIYPKQEVIVREKKQAPQSMVNELADIENRYKKSTVTKKQPVKTEQPIVQKEIIKEPIIEIPQGRIQYGYRDNTGAFKRYDLTQDTNSKEAFEKAKSQPGFRIINEKDLTTQSGYTPNQLALGGNLNNTNTMNDINMFNEGGSHKSNPLGGIPQGMGQNGQMNTVEEGEGRSGDMIYSDRIPLTEEAVMAVGLPRKYAGKTPAQALSEIDRIFKDRNDKAAQETKADFTEKIAQAQELVKQQQAQIEQSMSANAGEVPDMMGGQIPQGMEEFVQHEQMMGQPTGEPMLDDGRLQTGMQEQPQMFMRGGRLNRYQNKMEDGGDLENPEINPMAILGGANTLFDFGQQIFGGSGIDTTGRQDMTGQKANTGGLTASNALKGASAGTAIMPGIGTAAGALVGGISGLIGGGKRKRDLSLANRNNNLMQYAQQNSDFAYGGKVNKYRFGGDPNDPRNKSLYPEVDYPTESSDNQNIIQFPTEKMGNLKPSIFNKMGDWMQDNKDDIRNTKNAALRLTPIAMNLARLKKAGQYDTVNPILNDQRFQPKYIDEQSVQNIASSEMNNQVRGIGQSGASQGAMRSSILGAGLNKAKALSSGMIQSQAQNNQMDIAGQEFNRANTEANIQRRVIAEDLTARNKGAALTNKNRLLDQIGTDIGSIGKEETFKKIAEITGYNWLGKFINANPNATLEETLAAAKEQSGTTEMETNAYGGKLKLKRY